MNIKLTLSINKETIEKAKAYANSQNQSLSGLIENYLNRLIQKTEIAQKVSPLVESLTGVIPNSDESKDKKEYYDYLEKKTLKKRKL